MAISFSKLEAIYHAEGRMTPVEEGALKHEVTLTDHLGNSRVTLADLNDDGIITLLDNPDTQEDEGEIVQENHYYPFGMNMNGTWDKTGNDYQYNGKELNEDLGLDLSDYGARWYDASIGRWGQVDPLSSSMAAWSPYNYTFNNPIRFIDPDGKAPGDPPYIYKLIGEAANYVVNTAVPKMADSPVEGFTAARNTRVGGFVDGIVNATASPILDVTTTIAFPIINQIGVVVQEGVHEGPAYDERNNILPNSYSWDEDWNLITQKSMSSLSPEESEKRGKKLIGNTIKVITVSVAGPSETVAQKAATMAVKTAINEATAKMLEVDECNDPCN